MSIWAEKYDGEFEDDADCDEIDLDEEEIRRTREEANHDYEQATR